MRTYTLDADAIATDQRVWIGIDAHERTLHLTILDENEVLYRESIPHEKTHLEGVIERLPGCEIEAVYEAGSLGYRLLEWLEDLGCDAMMTPPSKVKTDKGGKEIKTDARDSLELAEQLRAKLLPEVHDHGRTHYRRRELTRTREQLVETRTSISNQIKSKLTFHGIEIPEALSTSWSKDFLAWLESNPTDDACLNTVLAELVGTRRELTRRIKRLEETIEELAHEMDPSLEASEAAEASEASDDEQAAAQSEEESHPFEDWIRLLQTVPGIGLLRAMILVLELGKLERFVTTETFASYVGLIPGEWSSGGNQRKRSMVRWGNKRARTVLVEASWTLIDHDERMREVYERIKRRRGSGRAICAVARRLGLAIRAMLRDKEPYQCKHPSESRDDQEDKVEASSPGEELQEVIEDP